MNPAIAAETAGAQVSPKKGVFAVKCQQALELLGDLLDEQLDRRDRFRLRLHLLICRHCRRYLSSYQKTIRAEKGLLTSTIGGNAEELPDELVKSILTRFPRSQSEAEDFDT